jgi:hypothetical protein
MKVGMLALLVATLPAAASAATTGRWLSAYTDGASEYGISNDIEARTIVRIVCVPDSAAIYFRIDGQDPEPSSAIYFRIDGRSPEPNSHILVTIGRKRLEVPVNERGVLTTGNSVQSGYFHSLWKDIRGGSRMTVHFSTGQEAVFSLAGSSSVLPRDACSTHFDR